VRRQRRDLRHRGRADVGVFPRAAVKPLQATVCLELLATADPALAASLTDDEVYALTAYVLYLNDIVGDDLVLDRESLPKLVMPNADGFYPGVGFMSVDGEPDVKAPACMKNCPMSGEEISSLPESVRGAHGNLALQSRPIGYIRQGESLVEVQAAAAGGAAAAVAEVTPEALAEQVGCLACHAVVGTRKLGPSFNEVQARYQAEAGARAMLLAKLEAGGAGNWGEMPMPSVSYLPATDRERLVDWILSTPATGATP
ncbi:MAG: c-type cytochrome, partial [Steroidobacteraceae bacterium]